MTAVVRVADLFCGAGGSSTGMAQACKDAGVQLRLSAVNHWDVAIATHEKNHPNARHRCANVDEIRLDELAPGGVDVLWGSPSCFAAGTLILTKRGLIPIECVIEGDQVLTHRGRWRAVACTMRAVKPTVKVVGQGCSAGIVTTAEHPFLSRSRSRRWDNGIRNWTVRLNDDEAWTEAINLKGRFWATPTRVDALVVPVVDGVRMGEAFWWMVGRWLGDGGIRLKEPASRNVRVVKRDRPLGTPCRNCSGAAPPNRRHPHLAAAYCSGSCRVAYYANLNGRRRGEVRIMCGKHESEELQAALADTHLNWVRTEPRTVSKFTVANVALARWLYEHFGARPEGKTIPAWALGMNACNRKALVDGYVSADGHSNARVTSCSTISRRLALGVRLLVESLGMRATLHAYGPPKPHKIEGRAITSRPYYEVQWVRESKASHTSVTSLHSWSRVKALLPTGVAEVFNISVNEDESYVADGIVVHNCTEHSYAKGGSSVDDQKRASAWAIPRAIEAWRPKVIVVENVRPFLKWGPTEPIIDGKTKKPKRDAKGDPIMRPIKKRQGETFRAWFAAIESLGYTGRWELLNAADYGEPQTRIRLFVVFTAAGYSFDYPLPDYGKPGTLEVESGVRKPWNAARNIIDFTEPSESIFERGRPLSPNTMRRIEAGIRRYCSGPLAEAFLVVLRNHADAQSLGDPSPTVTAGGLHLGLAEPELRPFVCGNRMNNVPVDVDGPSPTITTAHGGGVFLAEPHAFVLGQHGGGVARSVDEPLSTISTDGYVRVFEPIVVDVRHGDRPHQPKTVGAPLGTVTGKNGAGVVEPFIASYYGDKGAEGRTRAIDDPLPTVPTENRFAVVEPFIIPQANASPPASTRDPLSTITTTSRGIRLIQPYLAAHFGERDGQAPRTHSADEPLPTAANRGAVDLVELEARLSEAGVPLNRVVLMNGQPHVIDIKFRMLQPRELARAQGFPDDYEFTGTKEARTAQIGNAVPVAVARALMHSALRCIGAHEKSA